MDWKIPATILILAFIVGLGILPLFSNDFNGQIANQFSSVDSLTSGILNQKTPTYEENVQFSMSALDFPTLRTATPVSIIVNSKQKYSLILDSKNLSLKGPLSMKNFTGDIDLKSGKLVGVASEIVSDYFDLEGKTAVQLENSGLDEIKVSDLIMSDFTANNGVLKTEKPQTMEAKISSPAKVYGFKGSMDYSNGTATISGTSSMIQANGLTIGISQIK